MHQPNLDSQRAAMSQLDFLIGTWTSTGLVLLLEGTGRDRATNTAVLRALGVISYDDERQVYQMRAFNDGRWLETDVTLLQSGRAIAWNFALEQFRTHSALRITDDGAWTVSDDGGEECSKSGRFFRRRSRQAAEYTRRPSCHSDFTS